MFIAFSARTKIKVFNEISSNASRRRFTNHGSRDAKRISNAKAKNSPTDATVSSRIARPHERLGATASSPRALRVVVVVVVVVVVFRRRVRRHRVESRRAFFFFFVFFGKRNGSRRGRCKLSISALSHGVASSPRARI